MKTLNMPRNVAGQSVRGADLWGRQAEIEELWRRIERGSVLLSAPRRYGKTSMMLALQDAPAPGWQVVYVNVEYVSNAAELANEVVARVLAHPGARQWLPRIRRASGALQRWLTGSFESIEAGVADVAELRVRLREADPKEWRALLEPLWHAVTEAQVLLILDEFPVMLSTFLEKDTKEALQFLHWFRALRQHGGRMLVGGSVNIEPVLTHLGETALLNDLERVHLLPFPPDRAATFVDALFRGEGVPAPPGLGEAIVALARTGVPFFLQVLVDELLTEARNRRQLVSVSLAGEVLQAFVLGNRCQGRFAHYLSRLRSYGPAEAAARQVLHAAAAVERLPLARVAEIAREGGVEPLALLARLESDWYLERTGDGVRFADGFMRSWWRANAPAGRMW